MGIIKRLLVCASLLLCFQFAYAGITYSEGAKAYEAGDFENARKIFERLAELGHPSAQFNLAAIYYQGQGLAKDPVKAYGWFYLAAENDEGNAKKIYEKLYKALTPTDQAAAIKFRDSMLGSYGRAALNASLLPEITKTDRKIYIVESIAEPLPRYPQMMAMYSQEGWVDVEFTVNKDGDVKDMYVVEFSKDAFVDVTINALRRHKYSPPLINGRNEEVHGFVTRFIFRMKENIQQFGKTVAEFDYERKLNERIAGILEQALAGDSYHQYLYGYLMTSHPDVEHITDEQMNGWYSKSAQGGFAPAQYALGVSLLYGIGCVPDYFKAIEWLTLAAQGDYPRAQLLLGRTLLKLEKPEHTEKAMFWINKAAERDFAPARIALAWLQATSSHEKLRNPAQALQIAKQAYKDYPDQVTALETLAAAYAATGDFKQAIKFQEKAIDEAEEQEWALKQLQLRLDAYGNGKAWYESQELQSPENPESPQRPESPESPKDNPESPQRPMRQLS